MSLGIVVEAFDTIINVQIMQLLNRFKDDPTAQREVSYTSLMETLNSPEVAWSLKIAKVKAVLEKTLKLLVLESFLNSTYHDAKATLNKPDVRRLLPPSLLQVALLLRLNQGISQALKKSQEKISERAGVHKTIKALEKRMAAFDLLLENKDITIEVASSMKADFLKRIDALKNDLGTGLIEYSLRELILSSLAQTQQIYTSCVRAARVDDEFVEFLNMVGRLLNQSFKSLLEHHKVQPIFLDIDSSDEMPFVALSRRVLFLYLLLAQLPDWNFKEVRYGGSGKVFGIQLVPADAAWRKALQATDIAQHKILVALGVFNCIHQLFSNPEQHQKFSTEISKSVMNALIIFEKETHSKFTPSALLGTVQRLEALLILLQKACDEQFPPCQIELVSSQPSSAAEGWFSVFSKVCGGMTAMVTSAVSVTSAPLTVGEGFSQFLSDDDDEELDLDCQDIDSMVRMQSERSRTTSGRQAEASPVPVILSRQRTVSNATSHSVPEGQSAALDDIDSVTSSKLSSTA